MTEITEIGRECRFAFHVPKKGYEDDDVHFVKEIIHYSDGTRKPNIRTIRNYERPVWITQPSYRNHSQKKEYEHVDKLIMKKTTQSDLRFTIAKLLDKPWSRDPLRVLCDSPYVYGADLTSTSWIKRQYQQKYPNLNTTYDVATLDIETDVINGTEDILMINCVHGKTLMSVVSSVFVEGIADPIPSIKRLMKQYIQEYIDKLELEVVIKIANGPVEVIKETFKWLHERKPDFLSIWNMDFDIPRILGQLEKYGIDPKSVLCDPSIPDNLKVCYYKQGPKKKVTASGKVQPINPSSQWHTLFLTASFYVIDAMCVYKRIRLSKQEESSYALDDILDKILGIRKLNFKEADGYVKLKWHQFMQTNYKLHYIVYGQFDAISMVELDMKTKDLRSTMPDMCGITDFKDFKSLPKQIEDDFFFFCQNKGYILATLPSGKEKKKIPNMEYDDDIDNRKESEEEDEEDQYDILSLRGWIVTLKSHMSSLGLQLIEEDSNIRTNIRCLVFDSDEVSAYPSGIQASNLSKSTTKRELIDIEGVDEDVFRMQNINLMFGDTNSIEYSVNMFNTLKPYELLEQLK